MVFKSGVFDAQVFDITKPKKISFTFDKRKVSLTPKKRKIELKMIRT